MGIEVLRPGDIGFGPSGGAVGWIPRLGQRLLNEETVIRKRRAEHVFVVTGQSLFIGGGVPIVEAMPSGARYVTDMKDRWTSEYFYIRPTDDEDVATRIANFAIMMIGTPYGFSDYAALALKHHGIELDWLNNYISRTDSNGYPKRAICSQLADQAMTKAGICVFNDGRLSQDVTPGNLAGQMIEIGSKIFWP